MILKRTVAYTIIGLGFLGLPAASQAQTDRLVKYSSPTLRLYTDIGADEARIVMDQITFYQAFIEDFFESYGLSQKKKSPLRCYLFAKRTDFLKRRDGEFSLNEPADAYFSPGNNRIIAFHDNGSPRAQACLIRQCARPLIRSYLSNQPPAWCEEGLACYFEGMSFDESGNLIATCNKFSRLEDMRSLVIDEDFMYWKTFFDERALPLDYTQKTSGANSINSRFSAQAWGVIFFYLEERNDTVNQMISTFFQGLGTGRVRTKALWDDLKSRMERFTLFFFEMHEELLARYEEAMRLREENQIDAALRTLLKILEQAPHHKASVRLAAEVAWEGRRYEASLSFFRLLLDWDPDESYFLTMICRCLVESGRKSGNRETLLEAVETGKKAVKQSRSKDPDCLAALAMAYNAQGSHQDALRTIRKATWLGGPSVETHRELEKAYSETLRDHYRQR